MGALSGVKLAVALGVTKGRVSQLKKQGMPMDSVEAAKDWYAENIDQRLSPKLIPGIQLPPKGQLAAIVENAYDIQQSRAKREHHEANLSELREKQALGELVEAKRVMLAITTLAAGARTAFEKVADKLAGRLNEQQVVLVQTEIDQVLADLASSAASLNFSEDHGRA